jgi:hypothetical protein
MLNATVLRRNPLGSSAAFLSAHPISSLKNPKHLLQAYISMKAGKETCSQVLRGGK